MKLVNKFALWYLAITSVVLLAGGVIVFRSVQHENDEEEVRRLQGLMEDVVTQLEKGKNADSLQSAFVEIEKLYPGDPPVPFVVKDTMRWHSHFQGTERQLQATQTVRTEDEYYRITVSSFSPEPEETIAGVVRSLSWIFFLLLVVVGLTSVLVSRKILAPFNKTLRVIQNFDLKQKEHIQLPATRTREFRTLNTFLAKMTSKALDDYRALKEFTENASHELQTPLAIIRGKLELLLESGVTDDQARLIMSAHEAIEKLSRTNQSLTLLTKLENEEYQAEETIHFSEQVHKVIFSLTELMEMKSLSLQTNIQENVKLKLHKALADILLMNVFSNAIRHNQEQGSVRVTLTSKSFRIENTGVPPSIPPAQLFQRFKKNNQSSDSVGLGLSIVKQICEVSKFDVRYTYEDRWHVVEVFFDPVAVL